MNEGWEGGDRAAELGTEPGGGGDRGESGGNAGARERGCHGRVWLEQGPRQQRRARRGAPWGSAPPNTAGDTGSGILTCDAQDQDPSCLPNQDYQTPFFYPNPAARSRGGLSRVPPVPWAVKSPPGPRLPYLWGARARLTAACRWRACGSCCWPSRPCARGWTRRLPAARPWLWCSAAPAPCRSCRRAWAAPGRGSARSAPTPPQAPVLQGKGDGEAGRAAVPASPPPSPGTCPAPQGHQNTVLQAHGAQQRVTQWGHGAHTSLPASPQDWSCPVFPTTQQLLVPSTQEKT